LAAVDVDAIAVGVDFEVVDGEVVDAGEQEGEVAALEDGEVAEDDVAAVLEGDGLVADAGLLGDVDGIVAACGAAGAEAEAATVDEAGAGDAEVVKIFSPEERVVPVVVAVVLIGVPVGFGLGWVVESAVVACGLAGLGESAARMVAPWARWR